VPFAKLGRREIDVRFDGGDVSSDGGLLLLRQVERRLGLLKAVAQAPPDPRAPCLVQHTTEQLLRQRVFGLCQGREDLNDHDRLRELDREHLLYDHPKPARGGSGPQLLTLLDRLAALAPPPRINSQRYFAVLARTAAYRKFRWRPRPSEDGRYEKLSITAIMESCCLWKAS
jgi:hypothetical protein